MRELSQSYIGIMTPRSCDFAELWHEELCIGFWMGTMYKESISWHNLQKLFNNILITDDNLARVQRLFQTKLKYWMYCCTASEGGQCTLYVSYSWRLDNSTLVVHLSQTSTKVSQPTQTLDYWSAWIENRTESQQHITHANI